MTVKVGVSRCCDIAIPTYCGKPWLILAIGPRTHPTGQHRAAPRQLSSGPMVGPRRQSVCFAATDSAFTTQLAMPDCCRHQRTCAFQAKAEPASIVSCSCGCLAETRAATHKPNSTLELSNTYTAPDSVHRNNPMRRRLGNQSGERPYLL